MNEGIDSREQDLRRLAKTDPEAAIISLVMERGSKEEVGPCDSGRFVYRAAINGVLDILKPSVVPKSDRYVVTQDEIVVVVT